MLRFVRIWLTDVLQTIRQIFSVLLNTLFERKKERKHERKCDTYVMSQGLALRTVLWQSNCCGWGGILPTFFRRKGGWVSARIPVWSTIFSGDGLDPAAKTPPACIPSAHQMAERVVAEWVPPNVCTLYEAMTLRQKSPVQHPHTCGGVRRLRCAAVEVCGTVISPWPRFGDSRPPLAYPLLMVGPLPTIVTEKWLPHPSKAAGTQMTRFWHGEVVMKNKNQSV